MKCYVIGNWKCHKSTDDGRKWLDRFAALYRPHPEVQIIVAPSFISLENVASHLSGLGLENVALAAQDISPFPKGSYTGAIAADMVAPMAGYTIIGHSERCRYFHETSQDLVNKVTEAADSGLCPIVCVDSSNALSLLASLGDIECDQLLVAYAPVDAVNFSIPESPEKVAETVEHIQQMFSAWPVVYGGSLQPDNVKKYLQLPSLSGLFVGSSSLEADTFADICSQAASLV